MVPEGWEEVSVGGVVNGLDAGVSVNSTDQPCETEQLGILKTSSVSDGVFRPERNKLVDAPEEISRLKEPVSADTIVISRMNTPALVGANGYVSNDMPNLFLPDRLWAIKANATKVNCRWLGFWFASGHTRYRLSSLATGTSGSMKNITKGDVKSLRFPLPPLAEQKKIAEILSTWDRAIEVTEAQLEAARTSKRALMQQLLTGKRRFPEFEGEEWKEVRLGDVAKFIKDGTHGTHQRFDSGVPMISAANVLKNHSIDFSTAPNVSEEDYQKIHKRYRIEQNDILLTVVGTLGRSALVKTDKRFTAQRSVAILRMPDHVMAEFVHQYMQSRTFQNDLRRRANITAQPGVYLGEIGKIKVPVLGHAEMVAINFVLDVCDKKMSGHQQNITKLRAEKKALMQQLLTGKRRVVV